MGQQRYRLDQLCPCVREIGLQRRDSWRTRVRRIYDHEFLYCFMGNANVHIEDRKYLLSEGDLVLIKPDVPHTFWVDEQMAGELYWLHCDFEWREDSDWVFDYYNTPEKYARLFSGELLEREHIRPQLVLEDGFILPEKMTFSHNDDVDLVFRTLYKLYARKDPRFPIQVKIQMFRLLEAMLVECGYYSRNAPHRARVSETIRNYIRANYYRKLSVREICECTQLNPDYAGKLFKKETGMSLIDYLNNFRITRAKTLLLDTDLSIADVGEMVGFQNENYFSSVSKKITGMPPARLRQHMLYIAQQTEPEEE